MGKFGIRASLAASMAIASLLGAGSWVGADDDHHKVKANLSGYQETPSTLTTPGTGKFTARIDTDAQTIDYKLSYEGLEAPAVAAHIHLGARATGGGVIAFLCSGGNKPACPPAGGTVTGTITPADVSDRRDRALHLVSSRGSSVRSATGRCTPTSTQR